MNAPASPPRPVATTIRYLSILVGCICLLLAAACLVIAAQVFVQTGLFAQSYAMIALIGAGLGGLALTMARVWR